MCKIKILTVSLLLILALMNLTGCSQQQDTSATESTTYVYVGSVNSDKYHYPSCQWAQRIHPENEIWFSSEEDAEEQGYVACKVCSP